MGEFLFENLPNFFWSLAVFVIFVLILWRPAVQAIVGAVDARDKRLRDQLAEAEKTFARAKNMQADLDARLANAEQKIAAMMADARRHAEQVKSDAVTEGQEEVERFRLRTLREIETARHEAIVSLHRQVAEIATLTAENILREELDERRHEQLVLSAINALESQPRRNEA